MQSFIVHKYWHTLYVVFGPTCTKQQSRPNINPYRVTNTVSFTILRFNFSAQERVNNLHTTAISTRVILVPTAVLSTRTSETVMAVVMMMLMAFGLGSMFGAIERNIMILSVVLRVLSTSNCSWPWTCAYLRRSSKSLWAQPGSDLCRARSWTSRHRVRSSPVAQPPGSLRSPRKDRWSGTPLPSCDLASRSWSASRSSSGKGQQLTPEMERAHRWGLPEGRACWSSDCVCDQSWRTTGQTGHASDRCPCRYAQRRFVRSPTGGACDVCHVFLDRWWRRRLGAFLVDKLKAN